VEYVLIKGADTETGDTGGHFCSEFSVIIWYVDIIGFNKI